MDGLALAAACEAAPATRAIPIVAVTAAPERVSRQAALAAGYEAFVVKPIDARQLPEAVATLTKG
jgi:CheY-like chemotaxis protein